MGLYRALLRLYPRGFRDEYGDELGEIFAGRRAAAVGRAAVARLWLDALVDVVRNAVPLHLDVLRQDLRYAFRSFNRSPGFALTVVLVAALGIGANTAVFTITDLVLVRPLPFESADRLVHIWEHPPEYSRMEPSPANYRDWRSMATSFDGMAASAGVSMNLTGGAEPVRLVGAAVTADLLPLLGARPILGRLFTEEDDRDGATGTLILSHPLWQGGFGGDPGVIGRDVLLDGEPHVVIGVMPAEFRYPTRAAEFWTAMRFAPDSFDDRDNNYLNVVARLKPGVSIEQAREEMRLVASRLEAEYPVENERTAATVVGLRDEIPGRSRLLLIALLGASACVLLIACTNLANMLIARSMVRRQELAVRGSLGAGRGRLIQQLLTESLVLAGVGGFLGILVARLSFPLLGRLVPASLPVGGAAALDGRVLLFALAITLLTGIGFGAIPALRVGRSAGMADLRDTGRAGGGRRGRLRGVLVTTEVAASVVLLIVAGLLVRSLVHVQSTDPGFRADGVITVRTWLPWPKYEATATRGNYYERVLQEVTSLPDVTSAAFTSFLPVAFGGGIWPVVIPGVTADPASAQRASLRFVTPDYFETLGIPLVSGRDVRTTDDQGQPFVAVVSESFAQQHWPGEGALGQRFEFAFFERTVVGVVGDVRVRGLEGPSEPQVYLPYLQVPDGGVPFYAPKDLAIRTSGDPLAVVPTIREIVRRVDPDQPISDVRLLTGIVEADSAPRRVQLRVLGAFAAIAILLAAIGIHGVLSFTTEQRAHEIGMRIALGARRRAIVGMVLREGALLAGAGVAIGAFVGYGAGRGMQALLAGVRPADVMTFVVAVALTVVVSLISCLIPALRAGRVDPIAVIRDGSLK